MNNYFKLIVGICVFLRDTLRVVLGAAYSARMVMVNCAWLQTEEKS